MSSIYDRVREGAGINFILGGATFASLIVASSLCPATAKAQSEFARDRNVAVTDRIPAGYEPLGLRAGAFNVAPKLDITLEKNDNIYYQELNRTGDAIVGLAPSVLIKSDWGRHELKFGLNADYSAYEKHSSENTLFWDASAAGRLDIHGFSYAYAGADYSQNYEPRYDPSFPTSAAHPIKYDVTQADIGIVAEGNRLKFTGQANWAYFNYFDVKDINGATIDQDARDYTWLYYEGRADYAISPATSVYFVYNGNTRTYRLGNDRDSRGYDMDLGADFDITNLMRGSVQFGYLEQHYTAFPTTKAPSFAGNIQYFPTQLTTLSFKAARTVQETPQLGASGFVSSEYMATIDHELLRTLVLSASFDTFGDDYHGVNRHDTRSILYFGAKYLISRNIYLRGGYTYSDLSSHGTSAIVPYKDNSVRAYLGLQY